VVETAIGKVLPSPTPGQTRSIFTSISPPDQRHPFAKQPSPVMSTEQHHPAASGETPNTITATTVTTGCVECRTRRLYCETNVANPREACASCVRTGYICSNLTAVTHATAKKPRLPRNFRVQKDKIRINTACNWCRRQKIRCSGDKPCGACAIRDQSCIYPLAQRPSADANSSVDLASLSPATTYQRSGRRPAQPLFNEAY
jgi:hypothetical protein